MGRFDRRNSLKMKRRGAQASKKKREAQYAETARAERKAKRTVTPSKAPRESKEKSH